jgi:hypothetical protein
MGNLYKGIEDWLTPYQDFVSILLVGIILVSTWLLFCGDSVQRTAWTVFMLSP